MAQNATSPTENTNYAGLQTPGRLSTHVTRRHCAKTNFAMELANSARVAYSYTRMIPNTTVCAKKRWIIKIIFGHKHRNKVVMSRNNIRGIRFKWVVFQIMLIRQKHRNKVVMSRNNIRGIRFKWVVFQIMLIPLPRVSRGCLRR